MQNYNKKNEKNVHVYKKDKNYKNDTSVSKRELDFIKSYPIIYIIMEWGALVIANLNSVGSIVGSVLSIGAIVGGYNYSKLHQTHGWIMMIAAVICLIIQF